MGTKEARPSWVEEFFALSSELICIVGPDGRVQTANPAFRETLGFEPSELESCRFLDLVHDADREETQRVLSASSLHGQRVVVLKSAREAGDEIVARNRVETGQSIEAMKKKGLVETPVTPAIVEEWRAFVEPVYPKLRGNLVPADLFDLVVATLEEARKGDGGKR